MRWALAAIGLAACGTSFEGTYRVDEVTMRTCDDANPQPVAPAAAFVDMYRADGVLTSELCDDAPERRCVQRLTWMDAPGGATADSAAGTVTANVCELDFFTHAAQVDGDQLRLTSTRYTQSIPFDVTLGCDEALARSRGIGMPCAGKQTIAATRADAPFPGP
ncbi:MAG TPA: hypothetical protein VFQ53_35485 [Kofleriaceae bacterium]|nr:hypothetical protein [Kofleriaceae bacterium]